MLSNTKLTDMQKSLHEIQEIRGMLKTQIELASNPIQTETVLTLATLKYINTLLETIEQTYQDIVDDEASGKE